jgi:hypothetical protein
MSLFVVAAYLFVLLTPGAASHGGYRTGEVVFHFADGAIAESSGLTHSSRQAGVWFTHNDSGDNRGRGRFFAVGPSGNTLTTFQVAASLNIDWEDMARGPGADGSSALFFGDFGDNFEFRTIVQIYEVPEPLAGEQPEVQVKPTATHALAFEDGPHNAETLLVDPADGTFYIVTKDADGKSGVYAAAKTSMGGAPRVLRRIADLDVQSLANQASGSSLQTTGGDIAPDRSRVVIRTYDRAFEWRLGALPLDAALDAVPLSVALPTTQQGEAITYSADSADLFTSSEGRFAPVHRISQV